MRAIAVLIFLFACKPSSQTLSQNDDPLQKLVQREIGGNSTITKNQSKTFALAIAKKDESVRYVVVRLSDNKAVFKNNIRGTITWSDDLRLNETRTPGIVKKDSKPDDYSRAIDLRQFIKQAQ
ncbi:MAG TPA: hypothetical protein VL728_04160 [Cyclobacteriaceae bacterium]|jgi:hypothetical protein|nr:hypothetical protein [Cyclobacteriaceae bacterium]